MGKFSDYRAELQPIKNQDLKEGDEIKVQRNGGIVDAKFVKVLSYLEAKVIYTHDKCLIEIEGFAKMCLAGDILQD